MPSMLTSKRIWRQDTSWGLCDSAIYEAYVGNYELLPGVILSITAESGQIFAQLTGQDRYEIFPESTTEFFWKVVDAQLTFIVDGNDKATSAILHQGRQDTTASRVD